MLSFTNSQIYFPNLTHQARISYKATPQHSNEIFQNLFLFNDTKKKFIKVKKTNQKNTEFTMVNCRKIYCRNVVFKDIQHVRSQPKVWWDQNFSISRYKKKFEKNHLYQRCQEHLFCIRIIPKCYKKILKKYLFNKQSGNLSFFHFK